MSPRGAAKRPLLLLTAVAILVLNTLWSFAHTYWAFTEEFKKYDRIQSEALVTYAQRAKFSLEADRLEELEAELESAVGYDALFGFAIGKDGHFFIVSNGAEVLADLKVEKKDTIHTLSEIAYVEADGGDYTIRLAVHKSSNAMFMRFLKENITVLARDIAIIVLMAAFILAYFMQDIAEVLLALKQGRPLRIKSISARSSEGDTLLKSINTMHAGIENLEAQNRQLRNQVLPALNSELLSGRKPPYEFECTLVRVDVNNFSHIFSTFPVEQFMSVINSFFEDVTDIVSRYRGYVYEFIGDEVIFYFKDEEHANSAAIALSALRDINAVAARLDKRVSVQNGYAFKVKSALSHGRLRFGPQVTGFTLAGSILIETVRILSQISEKEDNVIFYDEEIARRAKPLVESKAQRVVLLKGLNRSHSLYSYVAHKEFEPLLRSATPADIEMLGYYRSDAHLQVILEFMRDHVQTLDIKQFLSLSRRLRTFKVPRAPASLKAAYRGLVEHLFLSCETAQTSDDDLFRLSSSLTMAIHILDAESFETEFKTFFRSCLSFSDRRVVANTLDVFSHFGSLDEDLVFHKLLRHKDNRVVANALVKEGQKGLTRAISKRTAKMLGSKDPLFIASALYVIGELARHHRARNAVHYETNVGFQTLVHNVKAYIGHTNEMVRRQALIAARKTQDEGTRRMIEAYYLEIADSDGKLEIERLYLKPDPFTQSDTGSGTKVA